MEGYDAPEQQASCGPHGCAQLKREPDTNFPSFSKAKLEKLIEKTVVDAYTEEEQADAAGASCPAFFHKCPRH